LQATDHI